MDYLLFILLGYVSGSILYAYWLPRCFCSLDLFACSEDHNPGTFNVFAHCGCSWGCLVLFLELGKGFLPVHIACQSLDITRWPFLLVLAAPVLGHAFPVWNHGKGGKSIATSFGSLLGLTPVLLPLILLIICYLLFTLVLVINPHLFRSIATFLVWNISCLRIMGSSAITAGCILISLIVIFKHLLKYNGEHFSLSLFPVKLHERLRARR